VSAILISGPLGKTPVCAQGGCLVTNVKGQGYYAPVCEISADCMNGSNSCGNGNIGASLGVTPPDENCATTCGADSSCGQSGGYVLAELFDNDSGDLEDYLYAYCLC
jgi:hypothetical protein